MNTILRLSQRRFASQGFQTSLRVHMAVWVRANRGMHFPSGKNHVCVFGERVRTNKNMQMKPQTSKPVSVGILISLDTDRHSHEKFLGPLVTCHLQRVGN